VGEVLRNSGDDGRQGATDEIPKCRLIKPGLTGRRGKRALDEWQSILVQNHNTSLQNNNKADFACFGLSQEISRRNSARSFRVDGQHIFQVCGAPVLHSHQALARPVDMLWITSPQAPIIAACRVLWSHEGAAFATLARRCKQLTHAANGPRTRLRSINI
jgi:hypothetical protein